MNPSNVKERIPPIRIARGVDPFLTFLGLRPIPPGLLADNSESVFIGSVQALSEFLLPAGKFLEEVTDDAKIADR